MYCQNNHNQLSSPLHVTQLCRPLILTLPNRNTERNHFSYMPIVCSNINSSKNIRSFQHQTWLLLDASNTGSNLFFHIIPRPSTARCLMIWTHGWVINLQKNGRLSDCSKWWVGVGGWITTSYPTLNTTQHFLQDHAWFQQYNKKQDSERGDEQLNTCLFCGTF